MANFGYVVVDGSGKEMKGSVEADGREVAISQLRESGLIPISVKEQGVLTKDINFNIGGKATSRDLSVFCRQFVSMTRAGVTILEALKLLAEQTDNKMMKKAVSETRASVEKGETLADAMSAFPKVFPNLFITTVAAGEASGSLDVALERMAVHFEKSAKTQALVKKAMIYPCVVALVAVAVVIVMLVVVIPNYMVMFEDMDMELPKLTQMVVVMSNFIQEKWIILLICIGAAVALFRWYAKTDAGQLTFAHIALKMPIVKSLVTKSASAMLARTLGTLIAAGVPLIEAVEITSRTMTNVLFKMALSDTRDAIIRGMPLSAPLEECGLFPPMVYHMLRIGEESGNIEEMLQKLADYYEEEVEIATQSMMAAMEPMIIIFMALIVGVLIGSVMAPMLSMYEGLDNL
ncbi:type IV pilus assembly protein PilC [Kineothrix alysoides]|uniref:Type IV pilus assembly protein PilC n=1 Tax=Kineothrix alysoides TaxID=1469948 RepID=A0A4R1QP69_9FIRM|nr:type II secretion system F family protein [Kineothrix alysoides]TCL55596.1 type IV pilus assembly protein PilC [Kineothrix alysoides]